MWVQARTWGDCVTVRSEYAFSAPSTPEPPQPRTVAGRYRLLQPIGRGGMAEVFAAHDDVLNRQVAVKLFRQGAAGDPSDPRRAELEMQTLAGLNHQNLVTVYDAGTDDDQLYLVMELVAGQTLAERIAGGALPQPEVATLGAQIASALAHVHRRQIVHRDVKPANVLLPHREPWDEGPSAKLADFGIAWSHGRDTMTAAGLTIGTAQYLSPEQARGLPVGPATDIYALGLVLLESLTGQQAWSGTPVEVALARLSVAPKLPAELGPAWTRLLAAMTHVDPERRPAATDVRDRLLGIAPTQIAAIPAAQGLAAVGAGAAEMGAAAAGGGIAAAATAVFSPLSQLLAGGVSDSPVNFPRRRPVAMVLAAGAAVLVGLGIVLGVALGGGSHSTVATPVARTSAEPTSRPTATATASVSSPRAVSVASVPAAPSAVPSAGPPATVAVAASPANPAPVAVGQANRAAQPPAAFGRGRSDGSDGGKSKHGDG